MSKYVDIFDKAFDWDTSDMATYGDTFTGGILFMYGKSAELEEPLEIEQYKRMSKRQLRWHARRLRANLLNLSEEYKLLEEENRRLKQRSDDDERLRQRNSTLEAMHTTYTANAQLLEKIAGLFRPDQGEDGRVRVDGLCPNFSVLTRGLAEPWAFSGEQANRFIELVYEMDERNREKWEEMQRNEENSDSL